MIKPYFVLPILGSCLLLYSCSNTATEPEPSSDASVAEAPLGPAVGAPDDAVEQPSPEAETASAETEPAQIQVGEKAPAFALKDQDGKEQALAGLLKQGNVALVFYRSADW